ncbi:DUF4349 domain-containing protein [Ferruginibacter sp. HRS2-29]|uniref:DUF4349 domain-containing protein n=1 Tax=Ferruginibacter sp. HRS2-29 TaxID=2487334 RepID=UPI0020CD026B|nr:DUF4349 domain-containing protein [Ferruginibacter sp. HRS2-29]MCP9752070.1 DUF4349 domain-containing protein [Ferruginibacter sp. HRS2-29]
MFKFKPFIGGVVALLLIASCQDGVKESRSSNDLISSVETSPNDAGTHKDIPVINDQQPLATDSTTPTSGPSAGTTPAVKSAAPITVVDWSKKIIKTATVKIEVKDFKTYGEGLNGKLKQYGAYVAQEDNNMTEGRSESVLSIKVPVQYFDELMAALPGTDAVVTEKSIRTEDVTGSIVDTRSRLEAKKQMRLKYLDFLKESKNMAEVLQVQEEINGIQEEIESAAGRYASLTSQAAYSTINLTYFKGAGALKAPDESPSFFAKAGEAFSTGAAWVAGLLVGLVSIWPLILLIVAVYFIYKKRKPADVSKQNV